MWCSGIERAVLETKEKKAAMWVYPKVVGFNPPERWGHSACYSHGQVYIFGGCCGGLHFSDVLMLNLETMVWTALATSGEGPGPRDSHSAILVGYSMIVFGGTNGSKKVNDVHVLDLRTKEWTKPNLRGKSPTPRESHTATFVGTKMVVFGGSGEGEGNYLNDLHILDLRTMRWTSPEVKGEVPVPRDSHSAVAVDNKLFIYGGDCGDRYLGDVDVLDMSTISWTKLAVQELQPRVRAGHGAVTIGTKIYVVGGVGDKHYYNDVWVLDVHACSWIQLNPCGEQPRGRFAHTAVAVGTNIAIYGGCGEDERPINELLVLKLEQECLSLPYNNSRNNKLRRHPRGSDNVSNRNYETKDAPLKAALHSSDIESSEPLHFSSDGIHFMHGTIPKSSIVEVESEEEEHSLSLSRNSSPSLSDQDQTPLTKSAGSIGFHCFKRSNLIQNDPLHHMPYGTISTPKKLKNDSRRFAPSFCPGDQQSLPRQEQPGLPSCRSGHLHNMIGAKVNGKVDGAFDSGLLVTANINGKTFRGVLFAPGTCMASRDSDIISPRSIRRSHQQVTSSVSISAAQSLHQAQAQTRPLQFIRASSSTVKDPKHRSDLQGVVLTLGGPGSSQ